MFRRFVSSLLLTPVAFLACSASLAGTESTTVTIGTRAFTLPLTTPIVVDESAATLADMLRRPNGQQARWRVDVARGEVPTLIFAYTLIGPVTSVDPLAVLGQELTVTGDTVLAGIPDIDALEIGAPLVIAGLVDINGSLLTTLIEQRGAPGNKFLLTGYVSQLGATPAQFRVGDQLVDATGQTFVDCAGGAPALGDYIEIRATAVNPFPPGTTLASVQDARCVQPAPFGTPGAQGFLQAMITALPAASTVAFGDLIVTYDALTEFAFGSAEDLAVGVAIAVEGTYVDATHFTAEAIELVRPAVRFIVPVSPAQVIAGESIAPFGIPVKWSAQVRDDDDYLAEGMTATRQVEVRGYLDGAGQVFATRVRDRGGADANNVRLRGPVDAIDAPRLTVLGRTLDGTTATYFDRDENPTTQQAFFASVQVGDEVDVSEGAWNPATQTISGGAITLVAPEPVLPPPAGATPGIRAGTATYALPEVVFANGFE